MSDAVIVSILTGIFGIIGALIAGIIRRGKTHKSAIPRLEYHTVFSCIDSLILKTDTFTVSDPGKQLAIRHVLKNILRIFQEEMKKAAIEIGECTRKNCTQDQKTAHIININTDTINNAIERAGHIKAEAGLTAEESEILRIICEKLHAITTPRIDMLKDTISEYAILDAITDCRVKQYLIFTIYNAVMSSLYIDLQRVSDDINGDLNGMTYKGEIIGLKDDHK